MFALQPPKRQFPLLALLFLAVLSFFVTAGIQAAVDPPPEVGIPLAIVVGALIGVGGMTVLLHRAYR